MDHPGEVGGESTDQEEVMSDGWWGEKWFNAWGVACGRFAFCSISGRERIDGGYSSSRTRVAQEETGTFEFVDQSTSQSKRASRRISPYAPLKLRGSNTPGGLESRLGVHDHVASDKVPQNQQLMSGALSVEFDLVH